MKILTRIVAATVAAITIELMADSAVNSFAVLAGKDVRTSGDAGFVVVNAQGPVPLTLTARPGWRFDEGETKHVTYRLPQVLAISIFGRDGEERETLIISNVSEHVHQITNYSKHVSVGALKATTDGHLLGLYPESEAGAALCAAGGYEVLRDHVHEKVAEQLPCPADKCPWGKGEDRITTTNVYSHPLPVKVSQTFGGERRESGLYPKGRYAYSYAVTHSNQCEQCCCAAADDGVADVYRAEMETEPWIGLDRTDEGRKTHPVKTAIAAVPDFDGTVTYRWTPSGHGVEVSGGKTESFSYRPKDHDTPSDCYCGELHACDLAISDAHGCEAGAQITNRFTIVKLDVQIGERENEAAEETEGYVLCEIPDKDGEWTEEGTNALVQVKITCDPHDAKMLSERVTVEVRDELLYEGQTVNGRREYVRAKASYTVRELMQTEFFLHGHSRSEKYLGDAIKVTHPTSGAVDLAKFTIFGRPWLVPDYDRKHGIDDKDLAKAKQGQVFRFWINDDDDRGDVCKNDEYNSDAAGSGQNFKQDAVCGRRDLLDYTPVMIDASEVFPEATPKAVRKRVVWKLRSDCVKAVWTNLSKDNCRDFQTTECKACGPQFDCLSHRAPVVDLAPGADLSPGFAALVDDGKPAVLFVEGCACGSGLELVGKMENGGEIARGHLEMVISGVTDMYRFVSIRDNATRIPEPEPPNRPDKETIDRHFVFVHGFNVSPDEAKASADDLFKRLWQAGLRSRFAAVTWDGDINQFSWGIFFKGTKSLHYYESVRRAFLSAPLLKDACSWLPGKKVMIAHSLGNVLTSSTIVDHKLEYDRYFMLNAAVAMEAYNDAAAYQEDMVGFGWGAAPPEYRASRWWKLFDDEDFRHSLFWRGRFKGLDKAANCYSESDSIVGNYDRYAILNSVWYLQETTKGTVSHNITVLKRPIRRIICEGGWGFNTRYLLDPVFSLGGVFLPTTKAISKDTAKTTPLFTPFRKNTEQMHSLALYKIDDEAERMELRARFLGSAIPAETFAVGANAMKVAGVKDMNMISLVSNLEVWPDSRLGYKIVGFKYDKPFGEVTNVYASYPLWDHSDFKQVAYCFNYKLFDYFIEEGE